jgi:hypothetical protein
MESIFPVSIASLIYEFAGTQQQWKTRFSNDVLPIINKGYRLVGMICYDHDYDQQHAECDCTDRYPCPNCYSYGTGLCHHDCYDSISFDDIKPHHSDFGSNPYIPYQHWDYFESKYFHIFDTLDYWTNQDAYTTSTYSDVVVPLLKQLKTV